MLKVKKLFLSFVIVAFVTILIGSLTSCGNDDDITITDKENFVIVKNEYQEYKESYKGAEMPSDVDIAIDGANYNADSVTKTEAGLVTSILEINVTEDALNPARGLNNIQNLVSCFVNLKQPYSPQIYQYIFDGIFGNNEEVKTTAEKDNLKDELELESITDVDTILRIIAQAKNLIENRKSTTDNVLIHESTGKVGWTVEVEKAGFYNINLNYFTVTGYSSSIERKLMINNKIPFAGADSFAFSRVWQDADASFDENGNLKTDINGNDLKPQQIENYTFRDSYFKDSMGYVTEPYWFYLEEGVNEITLISIKEPILIDQIHIVSVKDTPTYEEYLKDLQNKYGQINLTNQKNDFQAEKATFKSSPTLYPGTDRSSSNTYPFSLKETKKNIMGGDQWKVLGDWVSWDFTVEESGYYNISMRARQNMIRGMYSSRIAYISENGGANQTLFQEMNDIQFTFSSNWENVTLGKDGKDFLFYFEKGKTYSLTLEVTLGEYAPLIERTQFAIDNLSKTYRQIVAYTTTSPDKSRDYDLVGKFPNLITELQSYRDELADISNQIAEISGTKSDKTGVIDAMIRQLDDFIEKPRMITQKLTSFSNNISSLGTLLTELRELPLAIDYISVHTPDVKLPKATEGFFKKLWNGIKSFFYSFIIDYSTIGEAEETKVETNQSIEVWMTLGRDQANVIRSLIDTTFTKETGIKVNLKLTGSDVLLKATLAGIGPDVALNVDSSLPVNYALRNAVYDLTNFDDFWDSVYAMPDGTMTWDNSYENVYHASSLRQFSFYSITNEDLENAENGNKEAIEKVNNYLAVQQYLDENNLTREQLFDSTKYTKEELQKNVKGIYALPEKQIFMVMFVRDDIFEENGWTDMIPQTWDDVIDLVAELQTQQLQFYLPVNDAGANALNPVFVSLLYQYGGDLYANDNKETGLLSDAAMRSFEYWTEFYTLYSFPKSASFVNRFRSGEMPIGISYYETYNTLSVFAPELKGKWSFDLIPGTFNEETGLIDHTSTASGTGAVIMKQPDKLSKEEQQIQYNASWEFLKWWTGAETQAQFGREMEGILGSAARHATANVKAFQSLAWPQADLDKLMLQWSQVHEMPQVAGSYIVGREIENAYREVINNFYNPRETLVEYCGKINDEINRKRKEFDLPLVDEEQ